MPMFSKPRSAQWPEFGTDHGFRNYCIAILKVAPGFAG